MSFKNWLSAPVATATVATSATDSTQRPGTVATVANVAVATPSQRKTDAYHREWAAAWNHESDLLLADPKVWLILPDDAQAALADAVSIWNTATGDSRTMSELQSELSPEDMADRELMTPAWLALYCWTLWANG